ncbi:TWiK family of potassium channels protein 7 [Toxocara canis]|uniref:TWiK family of potassium channels protein 7 n=2 Tax=Toxocara canis TaxID=6265 RepID=A0A0B2VWG3_TOXCA|nr:TWiK family of potassium channels protein 7 [Toxocara canis]VDM47655.1 unnamed protein product [Toxocara canis]
MATWKKYARIILPHVGLTLLSLLYISGGAFAFYHLERPNEIAIRKANLDDIAAHRKLMLEQIWAVINDNTTTHEEMERLALQHMDNVTRLLFEAFDTHYISASHLKDKGEEEEHSWTFITAVFFTATLLTTIGYGNLVPMTFQGRMFCISYALFGVPLILITVADIGKFLSENIVWLYTRYEHAKIRCREKAAASTSISVDENVARVKDQLIQFGLEHYISIPISLIVAILLGYIAVGAILLASWESWDFFSGFYFSFITMTTVGFGDIVPLKQNFFLFDLFYIIVGLAITTMCIDLVGIQYIRKIHYFGRAIKDARYALVNVGGRMVHVPDLMRYASVLQQKYGQKKPRDGIVVKGAYAPKDLPLIRFIDYGSLASMESLHSFLSSIFCKSREPSAV